MLERILKGMFIFMLIEFFGLMVLLYLTTPKEKIKYQPKCICCELCEGGFKNE